MMGTSSSSFRPASGKGLGRGKIWANGKKHYKRARDSDSDSDIKISYLHYQIQKFLLKSTFSELYRI
jgi:hypothetical protein